MAIITKEQHEYFSELLSKEVWDKMDDNEKQETIDLDNGIKALLINHSPVYVLRTRIM